MLNQLTQSNKTCQQESKKHPPEIWNSLDPQPNELGVGQLLAIKRKKSVLKVLNYFIVLSKFFKHLYPSQSGDIELKTGLENETICRAIKWLVEKGYIVKNGRGANKSCEYKVSSWFKKAWVQEQLKSVLPIFYFTALSLISIQSLEKKEIKRSINVFNFIKKQTGTINTTSGRKEEYQKRILKKKGIEEKRIPSKGDDKMNISTEKESLTLEQLKRKIISWRTCARVLESKSMLSDLDKRMLDNYKNKLQGFITRYKNLEKQINSTQGDNPF